MGMPITLYTATRALMTHQQGVDLAAHNIANVSTEGFSRQRIHLAAVDVPGVDVGLGVETLSIERVRDLFVDFQIRNESNISGRLTTTAESLRLAETVFLEPGAGGFNNVLTAFFNAWREVSNAPEVASPRAGIVQSAETLANALQRMRSSLTSLQGDANSRIELNTREVNNLTRTLASLNQKIIERVATGDPANDLMDKRDLALDRLSQLLDIQYVNLDKGRVDVFIAGRALVSNTDSFEIYVSPNILNSNYFDVKFVSDDVLMQIGGGEMRGLLDQRDTNLPTLITELNTLAAQLITDVNAVHAAGFALDGVTTGTNFFTGTDATDIAINAAIVGNLDLIAAAQLPAAAGDASNALAIVDLQSAAVLLAGSATYGEYYQGAVTRLGALTRETEQVLEVQVLTLSHLEQLRQSASGVSLDEEMVNLVQFQRAYEAAARLVRVVDEMLDTLINRTI